MPFASSSRWNRASKAGRGGRGADGRSFNVSSGNDLFGPETRNIRATEAKGLGAINVDGVMVDVASIRILRNTILNKADLYGM
jgi:hypothetical protein